MLDKSILDKVVAFFKTLGTKKASGEPIDLGRRPRQFDNSKETEIARIVYTPKGIYHIHFAKKGAFSNQEKVKYIDMLKTAALR